MAKKKITHKKSFPSWLKPTLAMIAGGTLGLVGMALLPDAVAPYAPALGVLSAKFIGGGNWGKYVATSVVIGGLTFVGRRKTTQVAAGALASAKKALSNGGAVRSPAPAGSTAAQGNAILKKAGIPAAGG